MERLTDDTGTGLPPQLRADKKVEIVRPAKSTRFRYSKMSDAVAGYDSFLEQRQMDQHALSAYMKRITPLEMPFDIL